MTTDTSIAPMVELLENLDPDNRDDDPGNALVGLERQRKLRVEQRSFIVAGARAENRGELQASEQRAFDRMTDAVRQIEDLITLTVAKAEAAEKRRREAAQFGVGSSIRVGNGPSTYGPGSENSYFRDLLHSKRDDPDTGAP